MKIIETITLDGDPARFNAALKELKIAIESAKIIIPPIKKGNGVKPIKLGVTKYLVQEGWKAEHKMNLEGMRAKPLDAFKDFKKYKVGFEWETGNISSSFRALMKLYKAILQNEIDLAIHVLPSRAFYNYLTDRVGNITEMNPYLEVYKRIELPKNTCILIIVVEHDAIDPKAKPIPKGKDGMSLSRRADKLKK